MYSLRSYQEEANLAAWGWLNTNPGNCVICLPTGAGKSLCIADLCRQTLEWQGRAIVLCNRKELIQQNAEKIHKLIPGVSLGIYSAGLNFRHTDHDVIVAGIQSVHRKAAEFGARHLLVPDECHLIPAAEDGMYRQFIGDLRSINPHLRVVGMTATPFRTGEGSLVRADGIFQGVAYSADLSSLIAAGYLCPITNTPADNQADTSRLHVRAGEFVAKEVEALFGDQYKVRAAVGEILAKTKDRHSVLIFCSGIDHAEAVALEMERQSKELCGVVTGDTPPLERTGLLARFRNQSLRFLCNVDVLTTGFDAPCIDAIAILRATLSPGLFCQMVGRGLRTDPSKGNVLLLDFGRNLERHGPIDDIDFGSGGRKKKDQGEVGDSFKLCPNCEEKNATAARECPCGFRFPKPPIKHEEEADTQSNVLKAPEPPVLWQVEEVAFSRHKKRGDGPNTLRVDYLCHQGGNLKETISEWVCVEHEGFAQKKAHGWWREHSLSPFVSDIDEAISLFNRGALRMPVTITTVKDGRWNRITARTFEEERPESWSEESFVAPWEETESEGIPF